MTTPDRTEYTALSDRMLLIMALRIALAGIVLAWSAMRPEVLGTALSTLIAGTVCYVSASLAGELIRRRAPRRGYAILSVTLLIDGLFLAWAMYVTGGTQSPIRFL